MSISFNEHDIEILGYINPKKKVDDSSKPYVIYTAEAIAGLKTIKTNFIYLKSDCTLERVKETKRHIAHNIDTYVIIPKSINLTLSNIEKEYGKEIPVHYYDDIFWNKIKSTFNEYICSLQENIITETYYIPPRQEDSDPHTRLDEKLKGYITDDNAINNLYVVNASAGVGKTTLARKLTMDLANKVDKYKVIPTYVESSHWSKLRLDSINELWEIIENSLRNFSHNLIINERLFEHILKRGYLVFIFDGFDELCGHRYSHFKAHDVLNQLANLSTESHSKLLLTTRTLYWESEIHDPPENIIHFNLAPFNTQQAKGYFDKFFHKDLKARDRAITLYKNLVEHNKPPTEGGSRNQFVNLPLCVGLIAEYVKRGATDSSFHQSGKGIIHDVLFQLCEREKLRKSLNTDAIDQLTAFEEITIDQHETPLPTFDKDDLAIAGFSQEDINKLIDHPLLSSKDSHSLTFNYDFLPYYLKAHNIYTTITNNNILTHSSTKIMSQEANGVGNVLEHCISLFTNNDLNQVHAYIKDINKHCFECNSFLFHLSKRIISVSNIYTTKTEKTHALLFLFNDNFYNDNLVKDIYITGNIENLDLKNVSFINCTFSNVVFSKCTVNENTIFKNCRFSGELDFNLCDKESWCKVHLIDCHLNSPANIVLEDMLNQDVISKEEHINDALRLALNKFWYHGQLKRSIRKKHWSTGTLGHSIYCDKILDAMLRFNLIEHCRISGVTEGGYSFDKESIDDLQRFMDNRQITGKIRDVYDYLLHTE